MSDNPESVLDWLRRQRRTNEVENGLMAHRFDLDGALADEQYELAWRTREVLLIAGVELYLRNCGLNTVFVGDHADRIIAMLRQLTRADRQLADEVVELLAPQAPTDPQELRREIAAVTDFLRDRLRIAAGVSRGEAMRAWADGTRLLRRVGAAFGVAGTDAWYLPEESAQGVRLDWYEEVISHVAQHS